MTGCSSVLVVGALLVVVLLLIIACQNGAAAVAYGAGSPGTVWRDDVHQGYSALSSHAQGLPMLPGDPINPVSVNNFVPEHPGSELAKLGQDVMNASEDAAEPLPPRFDSLPELGPQRMWQPTWNGRQSTFVDKACEFFYPNPRLWARDLDELQFRRSLLAGQDNLFEPVGARQGYIQLLAAEARSKKDPYTRATPANDLSHTTCTQMARQVPEYVNF
jgi:hypothetical protein